MKNIIQRVLHLAVVMVAVSSCVTTPPAQPLPDLTFSHLTAMKFAVGKVDMVNQYAAPMRAPNIDHQAPVSPTHAMKGWAAHRLAATGGAGMVQLVVLAGDMTETPLGVTSGIKGAFIKDQAVRYGATMKAEVRIYDGTAAASIAVARAEVSHSRTVAEDASINDRRRVQFELVEDLMADFNREMEQSIQTYMQPWLVP